MPSSWRNANHARCARSISRSRLRSLPPTGQGSCRRAPPSGVYIKRLRDPKPKLEQAIPRPRPQSRPRRINVGSRALEFLPPETTALKAPQRQHLPAEAKNRYLSRWRSSADRTCLGQTPSQGGVFTRITRFYDRLSRACLLRASPSRLCKRDRSLGGLDRLGVRGGALTDTAGDTLRDAGQTEKIIGKIPV